MAEYRVFCFSTPHCVNCRSTIPFLTKGCESHDVELAVIDITTTEGVIEKWDLNQAPTTIAVRIDDEEMLARADGAMTPSSVEEFLLTAERALLREKERKD